MIEVFAKIHEKTTIIINWCQSTEVAVHFEQILVYKAQKGVSSELIESNIPIRRHTSVKSISLDKQNTLV